MFLINALSVISLNFIIDIANTLKIEETNGSNLITLEWGSNLALTCSHSVLFLENVFLQWFVPSQPDIPVNKNEKAYVYVKKEINKISLVLVVHNINYDDNGK